MARLLITGNPQLMAESRGRLRGSLPPVDLMKTNIRYAENTAHGEDGKLQFLGWGARRARTPNDRRARAGRVWGA